jgi:hypothetical protein
MEFVLFMTVSIGVFAVCVCISNASQQLRGIRSVLETHADLVPVKVKTYQRRPYHSGDV